MPTRVRKKIAATEYEIELLRALRLLLSCNPLGEDSISDKERAARRVAEQYR